MNNGAFDAVVVGAGAAGIGVAVALEDAGLDSVLVVDRHEIGASFSRWPKETCFLTPSFPTNSIGMLDLNSIAIGTSPAHSLGSEHPSGREYARYLKAVARHFKLNVKKNVDIVSLRTEGDLFVLGTPKGVILAKNIVWAAGEFQYPNVSPFPGAELCCHSASVKTWRDWPHDDAMIIGGYESGLDAACHLAALGKTVTVLSRGAPWDDTDSDPSRSLSTYTRERLATVRKLGGLIELVPQTDVRRVSEARGRFVVTARGGRRWESPAPPILATGFLGGHSVVSDLVTVHPWSASFGLGWAVR